MKFNENLKPYFNEIMYSETYPYEMVGTRGNTIVQVRKMDTSSAGFKPEIVSGGFVGHCVNQSEQHWNYHSNDHYPIIELRWSKAKNGWYSKYGAKFYNSDKPVYYYDYNF